MAFPQHQTQTRRPCHFKGLTKKHVLPLAEICSPEFTSSQVVDRPSRFSRVGLALTSFEIWLFSTIFGLFQSLRCLGFAGLIGRTWKNIFSLKREKFYLQKIKVIKIQSRFSKHMDKDRLLRSNDKKTGKRAYYKTGLFLRYYTF